MNIYIFVKDLFFSMISSNYFPKTVASTYNRQKGSPDFQDGLAQSVLIYDPRCREQIWRFFTSSYSSTNNPTLVLDSRDNSTIILRKRTAASSCTSWPKYALKILVAVFTLITIFLAEQIKVGCKVKDSKLQIVKEPGKSIHTTCYL